MTSTFTPRPRFPRSLLVPAAAAVVAGFLGAVSPGPFALPWIAVCALNCFIAARGLRSARCDRCRSRCPWRRYRCEWGGGRTEALCRRCLGSLEG